MCFLWGSPAGDPQVNSGAFRLIKNPPAVLPAHLPDPVRHAEIEAERRENRERADKEREHHALRPGDPVLWHILKRAIRREEVMKDKAPYGDNDEDGDDRQIGRASCRERV